MRIYSLLLTLVLLLSPQMIQQCSAQDSLPSGDRFDYYLHPSLDKPLVTIPYKWKSQPIVDSWTGMENAVKQATLLGDGYGLFQLAYIEYVHQYTHKTLDVKTLLYHAFEIGKKNGDPYLMYWVTEFEGVALYNFEYLDRRRSHALWTDSVASDKKEWWVLDKLADLNERSYKEMMQLATLYIRHANLKTETYGLLNFDVRKKMEELKK